MAKAVIPMNISKQTSLLFSIFTSSRPVRLFLYVTRSPFLQNAEALCFLMLSTSTFCNKQWKCELSDPHEIPSFCIQLRCWLHFRSSDAVCLSWAVRAMDGQLLLKNNNYNNDNDHGNNINKNNINKTNKYIV